MFQYHAVVRREQTYVPCGRELASGAGESVEKEPLPKSIGTEIFCASTKTELKAKLNDPSVVEIIAIFRGRQIKFAEKRNVQLC